MVAKEALRSLRSFLYVVSEGSDPGSFIYLKLRLKNEATPKIPEAEVVICPPMWRRGMSKFNIFGRTFLFGVQSNRRSTRSGRYGVRNVVGQCFVEAACS